MNHSTDPGPLPPSTLTSSSSEAGVSVPLAPLPQNVPPPPVMGHVALSPAQPSLPQQVPPVQKTLPQQISSVQPSLSQQISPVLQQTLPQQPQPQLQPSQLSIPQQPVTLLQPQPTLPQPQQAPQLQIPQPQPILSQQPQLSLPQPQLSPVQQAPAQQQQQQKAFPRSVSTAAAAAAIIAGNGAGGINNPSGTPTMISDPSKHNTPITTHSIGIIGENYPPKTGPVIESVGPQHPIATTPVITPTITTPPIVSTPTVATPVVAATVPGAATAQPPQPQPPQPSSLSSSSSSSSSASSSSSRKKTVAVIQAAAPTKVIGVGATLPAMGQTVGAVQPAETTFHSSHKHGSSKRNQAAAMNMAQSQVQMKGHPGYSVPVQMGATGPMYVPDKQTLKAQQMMAIKMQQQQQQQLQLQQQQQSQHPPQQQGFSMYKVNLAGKKTKKKRSHNETNSSSEEDDRINAGVGALCPKPPQSAGPVGVCNYPNAVPSSVQPVSQMMRAPSWMARYSNPSTYNYMPRNDEMTKRDHYILTVKDRYKLDFLSDSDDDDAGSCDERSSNSCDKDAAMNPPPPQRKKRAFELRERWEECKAGGATFYIPTVLMGKVMGKDGSGIKVLMKVMETAWKSPMRLSPVVKEDLKKYLPKGQEDLALEEMFSGKNVNFGNPLRDFFYCLGRSAFESKFKAYRTQNYALRYANHLEALREYYVKFLAEAERYRRRVIPKNESKSLSSSGSMSPQGLQTTVPMLIKTRPVTPQIPMPQYSQQQQIQQQQQQQVQQQMKQQMQQVQVQQIQMTQPVQQQQVQMQQMQQMQQQQQQIQIQQVQQTQARQTQILKENDKSKAMVVEPQIQPQSSFKPPQVQGYPSSYKRGPQPHEVQGKAPFMLFTFLKSVFAEFNSQPIPFETIVERIAKNPVIAGDVPTEVLTLDEYVKLALWYLTNPPPFSTQYFSAPSQFNTQPPDAHGNTQASGSLRPQIQLQPQPQQQQQQQQQQQSQGGVSLLEFVPPLSWRWANPRQLEEDNPHLEKKLQEMEQVFIFSITRQFFDREKGEILYGLIRQNKGALTLQPTPAALVELFHRQEAERYANPDTPYMYTGFSGIGTVVAPIRANNLANQVKPRTHHLLSGTRPWCVSILSLVRDAVARLPGGVGTRADVTRLFCESQYVVATNADTAQVTGIVNGALDRLQAEATPSVKFDSDNKLWTYLHRHYTATDF